MPYKNYSKKAESKCIAVLFDDDSKAERALEELKDAGFTGKDIRVTTLEDPEQATHEALWERIQKLLGKKATEGPGESLEEMLDECDLDEEASGYFENALREGSVLIKVEAESEQVTKAREILEDFGADFGEEEAEEEKGEAEEEEGEEEETGIIELRAVKRPARSPGIKLQTLRKGGHGARKERERGKRTA